MQMHTKTHNFTRSCECKHRLSHTDIHLDTEHLTVPEWLHHKTNATKSECYITGLKCQVCTVCIRLKVQRGTDRPTNTLESGEDQTHVHTLSLMYSTYKWACIKHMKTQEITSSTAQVRFHFHISYRVTNTPSGDVTYVLNIRVRKSEAELSRS